MTAKKHKEKWEGKHRIKITESVFDSGNPAFGLVGTPGGRPTPGAIAALFEP
jgi:hypothetical protein